MQRTELHAERRMEDPLTLLQQLAHVAHDKSDEGRCQLLQQITDVFMLSPQAYTDLQRQYFGDIIEKVAYDLEWEIRLELARRIASERHAPRKLMVRLANDEIPVAQPVLEQSPALTEQDLVEVSEVRTQEHMLAITKRLDIGLRLAAVLVRHGDERVITGLVKNEWAKISPDDIQNIATRAGNCRLLQHALVRRRDIPKSVMIGLLEHVSEDLKSELQDRIAESDLRNLDQVIDSIKTEVSESQQSDAETCIEELIKMGKLNEPTLVRFAKEEKTVEFLLGMAALLEMDIETVQRMLADESGEGLLIATRALDFSAASFKEMASSAVTAAPSDLVAVMRLVRLYQRMPRENAQQAVKYAQTDKESVPAAH